MIPKDMIYEISYYCDFLTKHRLMLINKSSHQVIKSIKIQYIPSKYKLSDKIIKNYPDLKFLDSRQYSNCHIYMDSNSRLIEDKTYPYYDMWKKLPHGKYGHNSFWATIIDDKLYYNKTKVLNLSDIEHCYREEGVVKEVSDGVDWKLSKEYVGKKYKWYYFFVTDTLLSDEDKKYGDNNMENTVLDFDGVKVTDTHIHLKIFI